MSRKTYFVLVIAAMFFLIAAGPAAPAANAAPTDDACALLTTAQVSSATTVEMNDGTYVTPTFKRTCTWTIKKAAGKTARIVTLYLTAPGIFESAKRPMVNTIIVTPVTGVGDEAYYVTIGQQPVLMVKKGNTTFKVSVYGDNSMDTKEAMEKTLAQQVLSHL
jgi:hypothetical protein